MLEFVKGDLFRSEADALVNAVNCIGVMGAGIAGQFKRRFPSYYLDYKVACENGVIKCGGVHTYHTSLKSPRFIINFPTMTRPGSPGDLSAIEDGLETLRWAIESLEIKSIAIPALGCGIGGLDYAQNVKPLIEKALTTGLDECKIMAYEPI